MLGAKKCQQICILATSRKNAHNELCKEKWELEHMEYMPGFAH